MGTYVREGSPGITASRRGPARSEWVLPAAINPQGPRFHEDLLLHALLSGRLDDPAAVADFLDQRARPAPDPDLFPGLAAAAERVAAALRGNEAIGIFGDYDTDGVTSAALLTLALRAASGGAQPVAVRLPLRREGYGLSEAGVDDLADAGARLLIAVDCGSKDHAAVARAVARGMDVVILDHHRITNDPPEQAILASAQRDEGSPFQIVSAAGIAYLLATALARIGFDTGSGAGKEPVDLLDLAMIGLIGDVSSLTGVNRPLVRDGLRRIRASPRPGLQALADRAGIDLRKITSTDVAFQISPRLNAPGRLNDPLHAYELLVATEPRKATALAEKIEQANVKRRMLQEHVIREVEAVLVANPGQLERRVLVFAGEGWPPGILGLAAGKLADRFGRPTLVLSISDDMAHGSARSIAGFDIATALLGAESLIARHGGHERAAGLALPVDNVAALDDALQAAIALSDAPLPGPPRLAIDADLEPARLRLEVARLMQSLGPFGEGNPLPMLRVPSAPIRDYTVMGRDRQHLKIFIGEHGRTVEAILWNGAARSRELVGARQIDIAGNLETNVWNGVERLQMRIADFAGALA
jgi:single-stranded-DNA-specific exonuclease